MEPIGQHAKGWRVGPQVTGITMDSRKVQPGFVFVAAPGFSQDGHGFIEHAIQQGAIAVVGEQATPKGHWPVPYVKVSSSRQAAAELSAEFYGHPSRSMTVIGVTGTNGKTTVVYWLTHLLRQAGIKTGMVSSVINETGTERLPAQLTTPESPDLQRYLAQMHHNGMTHAVVEVSSHGIAQHRIDHVQFKMAILTNITREHLDFHGTMEKYVETKGSLFKGIPDDGIAAIINADDSHFKTISSGVRVPVVGYGLDHGEVKASIGGVDAWWSKVTIRGPKFHIEGRLNHPGRHNVYNLAAVLAAATTLGISPRDLEIEIDSLPQVPGRMHALSANKGPVVVVDYAHTPDGLLQSLKTMKNMGKSRVWLVFGARGGRDKGKRPEMGKIAAVEADRIILTTDSPYGEDPANIAQDLESGINLVDSTKLYAIELDRAQAIRLAVKRANHDDVVLITGRGPESTQYVGDRVVQLVDSEVVEMALKERANQEDDHVPGLR